MMGNKFGRVLAVAAAVGVVLPLLTGSASASEASDERGVYRNAAGLVQYEVHLPPAYQPGSQLPVVVALHGCEMTGYEANSMKDMTRFNELADARGFIVVYPAQDIVRNPLLCWNANQTAHQHRGEGEPSLLAEATQDIVRQYHADAKRVYVTGASAGAAMSVILAVTYPDVYAAAASLAGGEYAFDLWLDHGVGPVETAKLAYMAMRPHERQVPILIEQGLDDETVKPVSADRLVTQWATIDDLVVDGQINGDVDDVPDATEHVANPGEHPYTHTSYTARNGGAPLIEKYMVEGLEHRWPGGGTGRFADPLGPGISTIMWDFFATRHLP